MGEYHRDMKISFAVSEQSSVGIEWEVGLVDADSHAFVPVAPDMLAHVEDSHGGPIRQEFFTHMVELVSGVHRHVPSALADLSDSLGRTRELAAQQNAALIGAGTHPFSLSKDQQHYDYERYHQLADRIGYWAHQIAICGTHIHVGVDHQDKVLPITYGLARFAPYFIALSASSPFWEGQDTQYASHRTMLFQQLPTNGLPYPLDSWPEFEQYADQLEKAGMIERAQDIRWDVRPAPAWGTIENRVMDSMSTLREVGALAAFSQCLTEFMSRELERGSAISRLPVWFMKENKWRAARYGLDTEVVTPLVHKRVRDLREGLLEWIERLEPVAHELGCYYELVFCRELVECGPSYVRQRRAAERAGGDLRAVTSLLIDEMAGGEPIYEKERA